MHNKDESKEVRVPKHDIVLIHNERCERYDIMFLKIGGEGGAEPLIIKVDINIKILLTQYIKTTLFCITKSSVNVKSMADPYYKTSYTSFWFKKNLNIRHLNFYNPVIFQV